MVRHAPVMLVCNDEMMASSTHMDVEYLAMAALEHCIIASKCRSIDCAICVTLMCKITASHITIIWQQQSGKIKIRLLRQLIYIQLACKPPHPNMPAVVVN